MLTTTTIINSNDKKTNAPPYNSMFTLNMKKDNEFNVSNNIVAKRNVESLPPPKASLINSSLPNNTINLVESDEENNWVIISGFHPNTHGESIRRRFESYGVILDQIFGKNYMCLQYATSIEASKALCQNWSLHYNDEIFIAVRKLSSHDLPILRRKSCKEMFSFDANGPSSPLSPEPEARNDASVLLSNKKQSLQNVEKVDKQPGDDNAGMVRKILFWVFSW